MRIIAATSTNTFFRKRNRRLLWKLRVIQVK